MKRPFDLFCTIIKCLIFYLCFLIQFIFIQILWMSTLILSFALLLIFSF